MTRERIEGLRSRQFTLARRGGYDRAEVDEYLAGFADWLETDDAKHSLAGREIELVGERTGKILAAAQESADETIAEARAEAAVQRAEADAYARVTREDADAYARVTREDADAQAEATRDAAKADAARSRSEADEHSRLTIREADARLERAAREAEERTAAIDAELAALAEKRQHVLTNLGQLVSGLRATIDGPGSEDLGLPERSRTATAFADPPADAGRPEAGPVIDEEAPDSPDEEGIYDAEAETRVESVVEPVADEPSVGLEPERPAPAAGGEETRPYTARFDDTDEELLDDARPPEPLPSGRDPQRPRSTSANDPSTDEHKLTELL